MWQEGGVGAFHWDVYLKRTNYKTAQLSARQKQNGSGHSAMEGEENAGAL